METDGCFLTCVGFSYLFLNKTSFEVANLSYPSVGNVRTKEVTEEELSLS